jgi:hypothetical protein
MSEKEIKSTMTMLGEFYQTNKARFNTLSPLAKTLIIVGVGLMLFFFGRKALHGLVAATGWIVR